MKWYWVKTHFLVKKFFSAYIWDVPTRKKIVYLTFDDGPTPDITNWVLAQLQIHQAKATFFCIGQNIKNYPEIFNEVVAQGHAIGNHSFNHLNGWKTDTHTYLEIVGKCAETMTAFNVESSLFRPPYGKLKPTQSLAIRKLGYKIIMWDILSADFDQTISPENCLQNVLKNIGPGSIIIFHDSVKASEKLKYALPKTLQFLSENGYRCEVLKG